MDDTGKCETHLGFLSDDNPLEINAGALKVVEKAKSADIPIEGWSQPSVYRKKQYLFHREYPKPIETSFYRRLRQIDDTISTQGIELLLGLFVRNMAKGNPSQYSTGKLIPYKDIHIDPENLVTLDAQFCQDENLAFFARQPGTLIILSRAMHASQQAGGHSRNGGHPPPPAQIRTCTASAYGSYLEYLTPNRCSGHG